MQNARKLKTQLGVVRRTMRLGIKMFVPVALVCLVVVVPVNLSGTVVKAGDQRSGEDRKNT